MKARLAQPTDGGSKTASFGETNWWVVQKAGQPQATGSEAARESLCQIYWGPVFSFTRHLGYDREDAQDLTQAFFVRIFEKNYVKAAARSKGRFRSFLLVLLKRFLADKRDYATRQKRGGGKEPLSISSGDTEFKSRVEPADQLTPEKVYERGWAGSLLTLAMDRLQQAMIAAGKEAEFACLKPLVSCEGGKRYAIVAEDLGWTEAKVKVQVHRLRRRMGEFIKAELAAAGASPQQVDQEIQDLLSAFE